MHRILAIAFFVTLLLVGMPAMAMMGGGHHNQSDQPADGGAFQAPGLNELLQQLAPRHREPDHNPNGVGEQEEAPQQPAAPASHSPTQRAKQLEKPKRAAGRLPHEKPEANGATTPQPAEQKLTEAPTKVHNSSGESSESKLASAAAASLHRKDDMTMHLVRGGLLVLPKALQTKGVVSAEIPDFYMDETLVTNHQYVEFLNKQLLRVSVDNGVVRGDGEIWLLLGEVKEGYEPIVFKEGKFNLNGVQHTACPVLRVTAFGAAAYASFYGERLPTEREWLHAVSGGTGASLEPAGTPAEKAAPEAPLEEHDHSMRSSRITSPLPIPTPVIAYRPDANGVRGLNSNVGEWTVRPRSADTRDGTSQPEYMVLGGTSGVTSPESGLPRGIRRYPWEAFGDVGFRCVSDASGDSVGSEAHDARPEKSKPAAK